MCIRSNILDNFFFKEKNTFQTKPTANVDFNYEQTKKSP